MAAGTGPGADGDLAAEEQPVPYDGTPGCGRWRDVRGVGGAGAWGRRWRSGLRSWRGPRSSRRRV